MRFDCLQCLGKILVLLRYNNYTVRFYLEQTEYKRATIVLGAIAGVLGVTVVFLAIFYTRKAQAGNQRVTKRGDPVGQPEADPGAQEPLDPQQHGN